MAADALANDGHTLLCYKPSILGTNQGGIDIVTMRNGVVNFIDRQLKGPYRRQQARYRAGLAEIDQASSAKFGKPFAALQPDEQTALLESLTASAKRFFSTVIAHTMQGYYGDPRHGGNRDAVSWRMLGVPVIPIRGRNRYEFPKKGA